MIILAHRGWWEDAAEKNSEQALRRAFDAGFGVETDLRDHDGEIVVSHDPPTGGRHITLDQLLAWYARAGEPGRLALNVKADGLQQGMADGLVRHGISHAFVFDMAVPDAIVSIRRGLPCFTRESEFEVPSFRDKAQGVWMDCFEEDWIGEEHVRTHLADGLSVALVSPELHGRAFEQAWQQWSGLAAEDVMLCTDHPAEAARHFDAARTANAAR